MKKEPPKREIFFDWNSKNFWMELYPEHFVPLSDSQIKDQLKLDGIDDMDVRDSSGLTKGARMLAVAQRKNAIHYAAPLAGYKAGIYDMSGGKRVLVTESCRPVQPGKSKKIPRIEKFLAELCGSQHVHIIGWLKVAYESLLRGDFMPGQLLILAGPTGCGKTFLQWLITQLLGGRFAQPYDYMAGKTNFNEDLAKAEHLAMGDEESSFDIRSRLRFAAQIKRFCVEPSLRIHGKGKEAITLETFRRLSMGVNSEPEKMLVIPPLDADIVDKLTLIKCERAELSQDRTENQKVFSSELPNLAAFLLDWKIPKPLRDPRFGVKAFHHPELVQIVSGSSPEMQLLTILDEVLWNHTHYIDGFWRGSAEQLKIELYGSKHSSTAHQLFDKWAAACGSYLARLKQKFPERFESTTSKGKTVWKIRKET